mgnify:CR=1 FL=1
MENLYKIKEDYTSNEINKFIEENSWMTQDWVIEPKKKVKDILSEMNTPSLKIKEFFRIKIGE